MKPSSSWVSAHPLVAVGVVVLLVLSGVGAVTVLGDSSPGDGDDDQDRAPQIREELLEQVEPDPGCPDAEESPAPGDGEVPITVVRVVDGCLAYRDEVVPEGEVDERLAQRRGEPDVVAADRAAERRPGEVAPTGRRRPRADPPDQWALAPEHLDGEQVGSLWPADAPEVRVAIMDDGIDTAHADLADQMAEQAPWARDPSSHGTHIAGIVAAADDGEGVVGLTPAARLMDAQYEVEDVDVWAGASQSVGEYVRWSVDHGADVVNMSFGDGHRSDTDLTAVLYAELRGVVLVAGAGNCGDDHAGEDPWYEPILPPSERDENPCERRNETFYPAAYDPVLSVADHDRHDRRAGTSTFNASVDVAAPGTDIASTCPVRRSDTRRVCDMSGTSMAAPFVAATAALLRARHPDATPAAIREAITRSARTPEGQPADRRSDELGWGLLDPAAAARYLDEHPGGTQPTESPAAGRTHAAFKDREDGRLYAFDDGILHPVREVGTDTAVRSVDWSADRDRLVAADDQHLLLWNGPGSELDGEVFEAECDRCAATFVDRSSGSELVAAVGDDGVIAHFDPDTLEAGGTVELQLPAPGEPTALHGDAGGRLVVAHAAADGGDGPDALWLVDPLTGEDVARHGPDGNVDVSDVAVDATGERIAYVGGRRGGPCGHTDEVYLLDGADLDEVAHPDLPTSDLGDLRVDDVFFNGPALYATMTATEAGGGGDSCTDVASAGLWRLGDGGDGGGGGDGGWELVDARPVTAVRPVEGMTDDPGTGRITIDAGGRGRFAPTGAPAAETLNLGDDLAGLWATPTRAEVDLGETTSPPPVGDPPTTGEGEGPGGGGGASPRTTERAISRFEQYLHALGEGDLDTICEIAGPGAQRAEDQGFGPCEETFGLVLQMISPEQAEALRTATVDPALVEERPSGEIDVPVEAVQASVTFTESDLGSYTLAYQDGDWFIID